MKLPDAFQEKMKLPDAFQEKMKTALGPEEWEAFRSSYEKPAPKGLRINTLKGSLPLLQEAYDLPLTPVPWEPAGYYYDEMLVQPGKYALHEAGAYYIQEPSAMLPAALLAPLPGEKVLDLCAAPGGKTLQLACALQGEGLLVSNEIHPARARILSENVERCGIPNAMVCNETPDRLAARCSAFFDRVLVDAPCSGEGMFRKNPDAVSEWSPENVALCARRQDEILDQAAGCLRPGGRLVYSTCTFSPEEDEECVERFLSRHPDYSLIKMEKLLPHRVCGDGQFAAVFERAGGQAASVSAPLLQKEAETRDRREIRDRRETRGRNGIRQETDPRREALSQRRMERNGGRNKPRKLISCPAELTELWKETPDPARLFPFGDRLFLLPEGAISPEGLKVLRPGLCLGAYKKDRFEPDHALALSLRPDEACRSVSLDEKEAVSYLLGNTISRETENGWTLVTYAGYSLGFGKAVNNVIKNHYPKGLRTQCALHSARQAP